MCYSHLKALFHISGSHSSTGALFVTAALCVCLPAIADTRIHEEVGGDGTLILSNTSAASMFAKTPIEARHGRPPDVRQATWRTAQAYTKPLEHSALAHAIDPQLLQAIISVESNGRANAISRKGAMGLMQVLPETGRRYGIENLLDPAQNIEAGTRYLRALAAMFNNDLALVLAAYNAGERAVERFGNRIPPYRETQLYVSRVTERYQLLKAQVQ